MDVDVIYNGDYVVVNVSECDCSGGGGGLFDCSDLAGCNISILTNDAEYIATGDDGSLKSLTITGTNGAGYVHLRHQASDANATGQSTVLFADSNGDIKYKNDGGHYTTFVTSANTANRVYTFPNRSLTIDNITTASTTNGTGFLKGNGSNISFDNTTYLSSISGLNISLLNNDSGYITSAALSGYVPTYREITINGVTQDLSANRSWTVSSSVRINEILAANGANTINNAANVQTWNWSGLGANVRGFVLSGTDITVNGLTIGKGRMSRTYNTAIGVNALNANTDGSTNTAIGHSALLSNTTGEYNVGIGFEALQTVTTTYSSTAVGSRALKNATGSGNTAIGYNAGGETTTGSLNFYGGSDAGQRNTTGSYNYIIGTGISWGSNRAVTGNILFGGMHGGGLQKNSRLLEGNYNVAIGAGAFDIKTSGNNNIAIGTLAGALVTTCSNSVFIGSSQGASHATKDNIILLSDGSGNERMMIESDGRIGIGTTSPDSSALLDLTSATKGFAPPEMTATNASAISTSSRKLIIYVTTTNGTFTSAGLWMWNGTIWKLILAE